MDDPLLSPLLKTPRWQAVFKMNWADEQFILANRIMQEFMDEGGCGLREENDERGHRYILYSAKLPMQLPTLIGSGIHALRSSLDAALSILVEGVTGKISRVNFPFHQAEKSLRSEFEPRVSYCGSCKAPRETKPKQKELMEGLPEFQPILFEVFKPWEDGNHTLWALNKLDNHQKHRMLLLVMSAFSADFSYRTPEGVSAVANRWTIGPGQETVIASSRTMVMMTHDPQLQFVPIFPAGVPFDGQPVFEVIGDLYKTTREVLLTLYDRFKDHPALTNP